MDKLQEAIEKAAKDVGMFLFKSSGFDDRNATHVAEIITRHIGPWIGPESPQDDRLIGATILKVLNDGDMLVERNGNRWHSKFVGTVEMQATIERLEREIAELRKSSPTPEEPR